MHNIVVMYIERVPNRNSPPAILIRRSYRENGKVRKQTLANLSKLPDDLICQIEGLIRGQRLEKDGDWYDHFEITRTLTYGHVAACLGVAKRIGLPRMISSKRCRKRDLVMAMIVSRIINPGSKLATSRDLINETAASALGDSLGLEHVSEDDLYAAMDWLLDRQEPIENTLAGKHLQDGSMVLYDVSSSYMEGHACPLARKGYSRDHRRDRDQIVYGLLCDRDGRPIAIEVFEGNTADPVTVESQVSKICDRFGIKQIIMVGDRGMLTQARIHKDLSKVEGLRWISALRAPAIKKLYEQGAIQTEMLDNQDLMEIISDTFPDERLVVCFNQRLAAERRRKREDLLRCTEENLKAIQDAVHRTRRPLRGKDKIALRVGKILDKHKMGKHFELVFEDGEFTYERKHQQINDEAALDGIYVVRTNVDKDDLPAEQVVGAYKGLSRVERAFRSLKTVDLKIRPIFHYNADRVRAHVFICMLAYYLEWHLRERLKPLLFDDEDPGQAEEKRDSIVAPACRSDSAENKDRSKTNSEGQPVHSFQTLIDHLGSLAKSWFTCGDKSFTKITTPTVLQNKAFELLEVKP